MINRLKEYKLLAQCALAENRQAFGQLVVMYRPVVMSFLLNITHGDASLSDDLAQETFIKAYSNVRNFRGLSSFKTWLYRIAYNEYISNMRKQRDVGMDELPDIAAGDDDDDRVDSVHEAIARLEDPIKAIVVLHYIEDQTIKDISKALDMPEGTVKVYLMRGRERIKKIIADER